MQNSLPKNWRKVKLDEVAETLTDFVANGSFASLKENVKYNKDKSYAILVRTKDLQENFAGDLVYVNEHAYNFLKKSRLFGGEIILSNVGNVGQVFLCPQLAQPMTLGPNALILKTNENDRFYYYYFKGPLGQHKLDSLISGSSQPKFNKTHFRELELDVPPIPAQKRIASVLSAFDDKIEVNNKIAKTLEEMAQAIFKEWFVNFKFPGYEKTEFVDGELGKIPEGWEVKLLPEVTQVIDCLHIKIPPRKEGGQILLQVFNIGENGKLEIGKFYHVDDNDYKIWTKNVTVKGGDCVISNAGRVGAIAQIPEGFVAGIGRNMTVVRPERVTSTYLFNYFFSDYGRREVDFHTDFSTVFASLNVRGIKRFRILVPSLNIMENYEMLAEPIQGRRVKIQKENQKLAALRDLLLPKLMRGEIIA